jgi:PhnB protein
MKLNTYLHFEDNCRDAFKFYERVFGGELETLMTYGESPMAKETPKEMLDKVMHVRHVVGDEVLLGSDSPPGHFKPLAGISVNIGTDEPAEAERLFKALSEGGTVLMPIQETFWSHRFAMFVDRFGTPWMVNCERAQLQKAA